jgi:TolB protein
MARTRPCSDSPGKPQLFVINANGGNMERLPTHISNFCTEPSWSHTEPNLIAFTIAQGGSFEVAVYNMATGESRTVSQGAGDAVEPVWTRDGRHLIYTERTPNRRRLVLLDTKTGHKGYLHAAEWGDSSQADYVYP